MSQISNNDLDKILNKIVCLLYPYQRFQRLTWCWIHGNITICIRKCYDCYRKSITRIEIFITKVRRKYKKVSLECVSCNILFSTFLFLFLSVTFTMPQQTRFQEDTNVEKYGPVRKARRYLTWSLIFFC